MPRSSYYTQKCPCGKDNRAKASISIAASSLGVIPRAKSPTITLYICASCIRQPKRKVRARIFEAVMKSAKTIAATVAKSEGD